MSTTRKPDVFYALRTELLLGLAAFVTRLRHLAVLDSRGILTSMHIALLGNAVPANQVGTLVDEALREW